MITIGKAALNDYLLCGKAHLALLPPIVKILDIRFQAVITGHRTAYQSMTNTEGARC